MASPTRTVACRPRFVPFFCTLLITGVALIPLAGYSQTFTPPDDNYIVEDLPSPIVRLSRQLQQERSDRNDTPTAEALLQQATLSYDIAVTDQSPRAYGRTLSLLQSWPAGEDKPARYHILKAAVLQHNHEFAQAVQQLDRALELEPDNAQAMLIKAQIGLVTGDHAMARHNCETLRPLAHPSIHLNCQVQIDGVTGSATEALNAVEQYLNEVRSLPAASRVELLLSAAVITHRLGEVDRANGLYLQVLQQAPMNFYALTRYADLLLETGRAERLVTMLDAYPEEAMNTELRILLAEALQAVDSSESRQRAEQLKDALQEEFSIALRRDEALPYKSYARFSLNLLALPQQALEAARENWTLQREPSDTLLLAQAALEADDQRTLQEVGQWVEDTGLESRQLDNLLHGTGERTF